MRDMFLNCQAIVYNTAHNALNNGSMRRILPNNVLLNMRRPLLGLRRSGENFVTQSVSGEFGANLRRL
jgi:hypothetical protein